MEKPQSLDRVIFDVCVSVLDSCQELNPITIH